MLDHEGLVKHPAAPWLSGHITDRQAVDDLFDFWHILGPEVVRRGVTEATQGQLDHVLAGFEQMLEPDSADAPSRDLTQRWLVLTDDTFATLAEAPANHYLIDAKPTDLASSEAALRMRPGRVGESATEDGRTRRARLADRSTVPRWRERSRSPPDTEHPRCRPPSPRSSTCVGTAS